MLKITVGLTTDGNDIWEAKTLSASNSYGFDEVNVEASIISAFSVFFAYIRTEKVETIFRFALIPSASS